jgi:hypothetical protein
MKNFGQIEIDHLRHHPEVWDWLPCRVGGAKRNPPAGKALGLVGYTHPTKNGTMPHPLANLGYAAYGRFVHEELRFWTSVCPNAVSLGHTHDLDGWDFAPHSVARGSVS